MRCIKVISKSRNYLFAVFAISLWFTSAYADTVSEDWVAIYDNTSVEDSFDSPEDLFVDSSGYSYTTGRTGAAGPSNADVLTLKYNNSGTKQWEATYDGDDEEGDYGYSIDVDSSGNVYVTGKTDTDSYGYDILTIKYNSSGTEQWDSTYDGPGSGGDMGKVVAEDGSGYVYVAGFVYESASDLYNYCILKYDASDGSLEWDSTFDGTNDDRIYDMALLDDDYIYVTGGMYDPSFPGQMPDGSGWDAVTCKYEPDGDRSWYAEYDYRDGTDRGGAIAVDTSGNAFVAGRSDAKILTIKYTSGGSESWTDRYDQGYGGAYGYDVGVDSNGDAIVGGAVCTSGTSLCDYCVIKYDGSTGSRDWVRTYDDGGYNDTIHELIIDSNDNIYVTGRLDYLTSSEDLYTRKYDTDGNVKWSIRYDNDTSTIPGIPDIGLDGSREVYVAASENESSTDDDVCIIRYDQTESKGSSFNASRVEEAIVLKWTSFTSTDEGFSGYEVFRSEINRDAVRKVNEGFESILAGMEKLGLTANSYTDYAANADKEYEYRLAAVFKRPWGTISETIGTCMVKPGSKPLSVAFTNVRPNPVNRQVTCVIRVSEAGMVKLSMYDITGRKLTERHAEAAEPGDLAITMDVSEYAPGSYFLTAELNGARTASKISVVR
jgi:hypothetical protein